MCPIPDTHETFFFFMAVIVLNGIFKYLCEVIFLFHLLSDLWIIEIIVGDIYILSLFSKRGPVILELNVVISMLELLDYILFWNSSPFLTMRISL